MSSSSEEEQPPPPLSSLYRDVILYVMRFVNKTPVPGVCYTAVWIDKRDFDDWISLAESLRSVDIVETNVDQSKRGKNVAVLQIGFGRIPTRYEDLKIVFSMRTTVGQRIVK